jgi:P-type conjugative transfer protein TrbJ
MRIQINAIALAAALAISANANGGAVVGATEFTQIANNFQLAAQYVESAQQTMHQLNQYKAALQNLKQSVPSALLDQHALNLWNNGNMVQKFKALRTIVQNGKQVAYSLSTQDEVFKRLHPGYTAAFDSKDRYGEWSDNTHSAVNNALAVSGAQAENLDSEQDMVRELQTRAQSADGQLSMLKAGNDIGVAMIGQMQQLRQLQIAQMTAQGQYTKNQTSMQDRKKQGSKLILGNLRSNMVIQGNKTVPVPAGE